MENLSPFWSQIRLKKSSKLARIAFADSSDPRVLRAAHQLIKENLVHPLLIGRESDIAAVCQKSNIEKFSSEHIISAPSDSERERFIQVLREKQTKQNLSRDEVAKQLDDTIYFGVALLLENVVEGLVAGSLRPTSDVVKAALHCIGPKPGKRLVSGYFFIESDQLRSKDNTPFLFADCAVMPEPSARSLAIIATEAAEAYQFFTGKSAKIAMLSFSTRNSAQHPLVDRIQEAVKIIKKQDPSLIVDGELQADAALDHEIALIKLAGDSNVAGQANILIFPTLEAGNIGYKLVQRFSKTRVAGPLLWGLNKPMSDLSRGCTDQEVTDTALCLSFMAQGLN